MRFKYLTLTIFIFGCVATGVQGSSPGGQPRPDGDGDDGMDDLERGRFEDFCDPEADFEAIRSTAEKDFCRDSLGNKSCGVAPCEQICHSMFDDDSDFRPSNVRGGGGDRAGDEEPRRARSAGATGPSRIDVKPPCALSDSRCRCENSMLKVTEFDESKLENEDACMNLPINMPNCHQSIKDAISEYASNFTDMPFRKVVSDFLADPRININETAAVPADSLSCLDCTEVGCRNCMQRKIILANLIKCGNPQVDIASFRKNSLWNLCAAESKSIHCPSSGSCVDATASECEATDFCKYLPVVKEHCADLAANVAPFDFTCVPDTCNDSCDSTYLFKGQMFPVNTAIGDAGDACPLTGFDTSTTEYPGTAMDETLVDLMCHQFMSQRREMKLLMRYWQETSSIQKCLMKPGMMWGFSTFKDMRQTFTADMANARLKRSSGVEGPEDDDVDLADELSGKNITCMNEFGNGTVTLEDGGVCITVINATNKDLPSADYTLGVDYWYKAYEHGGLSCAAACRHEAIAQVDGQVILCCDDARLDGQPCNKGPMSQFQTFQMQIATQQCGTRCSDRKHDLITEMCTECGTDYDCYFGMKCAAGRCMPPVEGSTGADRLKMVFSDSAKKQHCPGALHQLQTCPLISHSLNPDRLPTCDDEVKQIRDPFTIVRGVSDSCTFDSNAIMFADSEGQCPCGLISKHGKCFEPDLPSDDLYDLFYPCNEIVRGFIEDVIDTNYTGAADCEANPLGAMMNGEDCPFNATTKLLFALPCEEACHILNAGSADAQQTRREAAATKAPDATVLRNLNDKCGAMKFRNLSDDTAKCAAAAQAVADLQNLVGSEDLCEKALDYGRCPNLVVQMLEGMEGVTVPTSANLDTAFRSCLDTLEVSDSLRQLSNKLEGEMDGATLESWCPDIDNIMTKAANDLEGNLPKMAMEHIFFGVFKSNCRSYVNETSYCKLAAILEALKSRSNEDFHDLKMFNETFYNEDIKSSMCSSVAECAVSPEDIVELVCAVDENNVDAAKLGCLSKFRYNLNRKCDNQEPIQEKLAQFSCAKLDELLKPSNAEKLQEKVCNCTVCDEGQTASDFGVGAMGVCKSFCPSRVDVSSAAVRAADDASLEGAINEDGEVVPSAVCVDGLCTGELASAIAMTCCVNDLDGLTRNDDNARRVLEAAMIPTRGDTAAEESNRMRQAQEFVGDILNQLVGAALTTKIGEFVTDPDLFDALQHVFRRQSDASTFGCTFDVASCSFDCTNEPDMTFACGNVGKNFCEDLVSIKQNTDTNSDCSYADIVKAYGEGEGVDNGRIASFCFVNEESIAEVEATVVCRDFLADSGICEVAEVCPKMAKTLGVMAGCIDEELQEDCGALTKTLEFSDETNYTCSQIVGMINGKGASVNPARCVYEDNSYNELLKLADMLFTQCADSDVEILAQMIDEVANGLCCVFPLQALEALENQLDLLEELAPYCSHCEFNPKQKAVLGPVLLNTFAGPSGKLCANGAFTLKDNVSSEIVGGWAPAIASLDAQFPASILEQCPFDMAEWISESVDEDFLSEELQECFYNLNEEGVPARMKAARDIVNKTLVEDFDGVVNYEFLCNMDCKTMAMASHPEVVAKLENLADNEDLLRAMKDRCLSCYPPFAAATNQEMLAFRSSLCIAALKDLDATSDAEDMWNLLMDAPMMLEGCVSDVAELIFENVQAISLPSPNFMKFFTNGVARGLLRDKMIELSASGGAKRAKRNAGDDCSGVTTADLVNFGDTLCTLSAACVASIPANVLVNMGSDAENPMITQDCLQNPSIFDEFLTRFKEAEVYGPVAQWGDEITNVGNAAVGLTATELNSMDAANMAIIAPSTFELLDINVLAGLDQSHLDELTSSQLRTRTQAEVEGTLGLTYPTLTSDSIPDPPSAGNTPRCLPAVVMGSILALVFHFLVL